MKSCIWKQMHLKKNMLENSCLKKKISAFAWQKAAYIQHIATIILDSKYIVNINKKRKQKNTAYVITCKQHTYDTRYMYITHRHTCENKINLNLKTNTYSYKQLHVNDKKKKTRHAYEHHSCMYITKNKAAFIYKKKTQYNYDVNNNWHKNGSLHLNYKLTT